MKISDPFCRVENRNTAHYRSFRDSLTVAGVKTVADLDLVTRRTTQKVWASVVAMVVINLAALLLFQNLAAVVFVLSILFLLWLGITVLRARTFLQRYRQELAQTQSGIDLDSAR